MMPNTSSIQSESAAVAHGGSVSAIGTGRVLASGFGFLEGARWHQGKLWFSDFSSRWVSTVNEAGTVDRRAYVAGQPSGLAPGADGSVLISSMYDGRVLRRDGAGNLQVIADLGGLHRGCLGDMAISPDGRIYLSTLPDLNGHDPSAAPTCPVLMVDVDGTPSVALDNLRIPNGLVVTGDGSSLIIAETHGCRLLRSAIAADGSLGKPEVFAELEGRKPDGICMDPSGAVWVCSPFTSEVLLVEQDGAILAQCTTPGAWAVACALGGHTGSTLFVLTAKVTLDDFRTGKGDGAILAFELSRS